LLINAVEDDVRHVGIIVRGHIVVRVIDIERGILAGVAVKSDHQRKVMRIANMRNLHRILIDQVCFHGAGRWFWIFADELNLLGVQLIDRIQNQIIAVSADAFVAVIFAQPLI